MIRAAQTALQRQKPQQKPHRNAITTTTRPNLPTNTIQKRDYFGFLKVNQGDRVALWELDGSMKIVDGPHRSFVFGKEVKWLKYHVASPEQYICVEFMTGKIEHVHGPAALWEEPLVHRSVVLKDAVQLKEREGLAVWKKAQSTAKAEMSLIHGPRAYMPYPDEINTKISWVQANKNQFLKITYLDGRLEHVRGPVDVWSDPSKHLLVKLVDCVVVEPGRAVKVIQEKGGAASKGRIVVGPEIVMPQPFETVIHLQGHMASDLEYLKILYNDGRILHKPGPCVEWQDPEVINSITTEPSIQIESHECVVVYSLDNKDQISESEMAKIQKEAKEGKLGDVSKRVVFGPKILIPMPNEWLHTFVWHGNDMKARATGAISGKKVPGALVFKKLRLVPDQFYYDVENVRTNDDALLTMKFMVYFSLDDVNTMLLQSHDPIAELINALTSDAIEFTNIRSFENFKKDTEMLGKIDTYKHTLSRASKCGITISKIVYRGYHSSDKLQMMHDQAIEARTKLKLDSETEHQALELEDLRIRRKQERELVVQQIEVENMKHEVWKSQQKIDQDIKEKGAIHDITIKQIKETNGEQVAFLKQLEKLGVNLTLYLTSQHQHPDKILRIENTQANSRTAAVPQVHLNMDNNN